MTRKVVIVGAGVIGLCSAYYCARRGFEVTVIDRKPGPGDGCSYGNAGMIVPSHFVPLAAPGMVALGLKWMWNPASPFYIKPRIDAELFDWGWKFWRAANAEHVNRSAPLIRDLSLTSRTCFEELSAQPNTGLGEFGLVKKGLLMLCQSEHAWHEEAAMAEKSRALGIAAEVLDAKQTAALDPGARLNITGSVHFPLDCHLPTHRFMAALLAGVEQSGVKIMWRREVVDARLVNGRLSALQLDDGTDITADEFVLCGGSWSPVLAAKLDLKLPMQAGKGYSLTLPRPRQLPQICSICTEARVAVTPMDGALRVGGTMEIAGLNETVNPVRVQGIIDSFCRYFPEFRAQDFEGVQPWRGLRPCSPDGLPYLGRTSRFANLSLATAHGMMGLSLGPVTGMLVAEILSGDKPKWDLTLLSPDRYN